MLNIVLARDNPETSIRHQSSAMALLAQSRRSSGCRRNNPPISLEPAGSDASSYYQESHNSICDTSCRWVRPRRCSLAERLENSRARECWRPAPMEEAEQASLAYRRQVLMAARAMA